METKFEISGSRPVWRRKIEEVAAGDKIGAWPTGLLKARATCAGTEQEVEVVMVDTYVADGWIG